MADNYTRGAQTFRSEDKSNIQFPVILVGAHVRTYTGIASYTSSGTAASLTAIPAGTEFADIYCDSSTDTDFVRFWHNSTNPTTTVGVKLKAHEVVQSADPATFRFIASSGTPTLRVEFYRYS